MGARLPFYQLQPLIPGPQKEFTGPAYQDRQERMDRIRLRNTSRCLYRRLLRGWSRIYCNKIFSRIFHHCRKPGKSNREKMPEMPGENPWRNDPLQGMC